MANFDYMALKEAIDSDPANIERTDQEVADLLNASIPGPKRKVPISEIWTIALRNGRTVPIRRAANNPEHPARDAAQATMDLFDVSRIDSVDTELPVFSQVLEGLVSTNLISPEISIEIKNLANTNTTLALEISGWGIPVTDQDINYTRSL